MAVSSALSLLRVGWWAGHEPSDPLGALAGLLLRTEMRARCPGLQTLLVHDTPPSFLAPGFTGEPALLHLDFAAAQPPSLDLFVASGVPEPGGAKVSHALAELGTLTVAVAPEEGWGWDPHYSVGSPFAVPEPTVLAARHLAEPLLAGRLAYLRVTEGLPRRYVLVERTLLADGGDDLEGADLELALGQLAQLAADSHDGRPAEVVELAPGPLSPEDPEVEAVLRERRAEAEEGRHLAEDWPGYGDRARLALRVTSPLDMAAAVAGAQAVVVSRGALMALAWGLGIPHVAVAPEQSAAADFTAWTGDPSAVVGGARELAASMGNVFARRGKPRGLKRLEATLDQALDEAASILAKRAAEVAAGSSDGDGGERGFRRVVPARERIQELEAVNEALRLRLAAERGRFAERASLLEKAANTSVESAIRAVHGQDVIVRRKLEETEREMHRLQEETALQQAELRAIHSSLMMRAVTPARQLYGRLRKAVR
ncbi:MAG TPA: hypothetical protein VME46_01570 [Acidimicrobiales bacterium]|nr:hypothetical protein [Acidimicrobiales bacterium]